jgi:hypothetical protein
MLIIRVTMSTFNRIPPQEYEKKRDEVVELLTKKKGNYLVSLSFLNYHMKLDEKYPPAYVVGRMVDEGILDDGVFYHIKDDKLTITVWYGLKNNDI